MQDVKDVSIAMPQVFHCITDHEFNQLNVWTVRNQLHLKHFKGEMKNLKYEYIVNSRRAAYIFKLCMF